MESRRRFLKCNHRIGQPTLRFVAFPQRDLYVQNQRLADMLHFRGTGCLDSFEQFLCFANIATLQKIKSGAGILLCP